MTQLLKLIGRRLLWLPFMILGITLLVFVIMQFSPTDQATSALGQGASVEAKEAYRDAHGLNDPVIVQYVRFLGNMIVGDLGNTAPPAQSVSGLIGTALPLTMQLTFLGVFFAVVMALIFGVIAALYRDRWPDQIIRVISIAGFATPSFWLAILLIQGFALGLGWFPSGGYVNPADSFSGWLNSMFLPAVALGAPVGASLIRIVRTSMVEELDRDYVRTAIGNGIPKSVVVGRNVLRNALITPVTVLGLRIGYLLGGAVVIEIIFYLPGMGKLILNGVTSNDVNLVQGVTLVLALTFVIVNIIVDMLYLVINPRIRTV